uniref:Guanine nucleotide-binding protein subunit gamma n=1 Tax=Macrostomum lignano TaxID=282301 RepID=A0A1I8FCK1_9PLAT
MADNKSVAQRSVSSVDAIKKMEKELYREALMRDYDLKRGSKYPPMSIEPFPYERQRLSATTPMRTGPCASSGCRTRS